MFTQPSLVFLSVHPLYAHHLGSSAHVVSCIRATAILHLIHQAVVPWEIHLSYITRTRFLKKVSISSNIIVIITVIIIVIIIIIIIIIIIKSYRNKVMIGPKMPHFPGVISVRHFLIGMMACMWQLPSQVHLILDPNEGNQQTESLFKWQFLDRIYAHL